jgi:hypothetical protein
MHVVLIVFRTLIVDHVADTLDVDPSSGNVSRHQDRDAAFPEAA